MTTNQSVKLADIKFKRFLTNLKASFSFDNDNKRMKTIGLFAMEIVKRRTRLGYGVDISSERRVSLESQHPHSEFYQDVRYRFRSELSSSTEPDKQNLTFSGQMLDSLDVIKVSGGFATIGHKGRRDDGKSNETIASHNVDRGYFWMSLTKPEQRQVQRFIRNGLVDKLKQRRINVR